MLKGTVVKLAWPKRIIWRFGGSWFVRRPRNEDEEDQQDVAYIRRAKRDAEFRPLRDVLADIEAPERVEFQRPARQAR